MRLHKSLIALLGVVGLAACEKNTVRDLTGPLPAAGVRFFNLAVSSPTVHFYAGDRKLTATTSANCQTAAYPPVTANDTACVTTGIPSTGGIGYGLAAAGSQYTGIEAGQHTITARVTSGADTGVAVSSVPLTVAAGGKYSVYLSGFYNATTKTADAFAVQDNFSDEIDWSVAIVRFVNAIGNAAPMTLYVKNTASGEEYTIGGAVGYKSAGDFIEVPPGLYDLRARVPGAATDAIVRTGVALEAGRVYTIAARGDMTVTSATSATRPIMEAYRNR